MIDSFPWLSLCLIWPLLGALLLAFAKDSRLAKRGALLVALVELLFTVAAAWVFDAERGGFQLLEDHPWIPGLNIHYQLGVDGISILFLPMTALLTLMALLASWNSVQYLNRFQLALMLALESVTIGVFTALDLVLFFLFWELTLPPIFFLIGLWGIGAERRHAAMKYTLYMLFGGVPLLFGIILLALNHARYTGGAIPQDLAFSLPVLLNTPIAEPAQGLILLLLVLGFVVKAPLLPFHTWLPTAAMEAPTFLSALLVGLKLGVYGIIRFAIPLAPQAALEHRWLLAILGAVTLVYGALIALQQTNLRRLLAYSSISHVGLVIVGIASFTLQGLQGAVMQLLNFGIVAGSLMLVAGMIQQRLGSTDLVHLGGLAKPMPRLTVLFFVFALSSIGVPGTNGFPAELLMILGVLQAYPALAVVALFGAVLGAAYVLGFVRRAFFGPVIHDSVAGTQDLRPRELALLAVPVLLVLMIGLYPQWLLCWQETSLQSWCQRLNTVTQLISESQQTHRAAILSVPADGSI
ncbi:NADH-ubiquinone oxidoreductase chain M (EC 1.6.5.3) [Methylomonas albis]|uniref:NADH-quinone oxidoreductase subunit M n=1 Tax=Methylomonas albis TaxID=1854563 RepID=A0ABR9CUA0_9GAMM|nr:NADH-quinone oxidoreductase subunit M [Methylomonas albis]MBD9354312.1 NADH-quinone oxidoreductase subunit M [Methylomonas albis]CAD6877172.1 NADH-ubiquinone oxidoreductase chain M (EC 1.6.5.3) [Methylomonas albis]